MATSRPQPPVALPPIRTLLENDPDVEQEQVAVPRRSKPRVKPIPHRRHRSRSRDQDIPSPVAINPFSYPYPPRQTHSPSPSSSASASATDSSYPGSPLSSTTSPDLATQRAAHWVSNISLSSHSSHHQNTHYRPRHAYYSQSTFPSHSAPTSPSVPNPPPFFPGPLDTSPRLQNAASRKYNMNTSSVVAPAVPAAHIAAVPAPSSSARRKSTIKAPKPPTTIPDPRPYPSSGRVVSDAPTGSGNNTEPSPTTPIYSSGPTRVPRRLWELPLFLPKDD
ncbi:hypothetical protein SISNIDRAFT_361051 [Sistotremastrum niveocremeum HHB9708]|uniref:Uncharacterized protein n=2 Tax=Sistotremastraceae TaxID=3402574 RepID=A0A164WR39_9AGAM|nr:hypothetical protein SISNIDRAFT_361051 [Sistotremastrum niveocremeum HHB9708]KZT35891.1 hypothetical protein SISSUDRAFT_1050678 [Sistotremastrum suecicum HHB10207 ss-3]